MSKLTIKQARLNTGRTLEEAAEFAKVHPKHLERMEEGKTVVYLHHLCLLSKFYGIALEHLATDKQVNNANPIESNGRIFSRKAVWLATEQHGERLSAIAAERIRLTKEFADFHSMGRRKVEGMLVRIHQLDSERDELIKPFQQKLENEAQQENTRLTVDLKKVFEQLEEAGHDMSGAYAIINSSLEKQRITTATTFGEDAEVTQ